MVKEVSSEIKLLSKHSSIYSLSKILNRVVSFLLLPLYLSYLTPAHYAVMDLLYFTLAFISIILEMGVTGVIGRYYFDSDDQKVRNMIFNTAFYGFGVGSTVLILLVTIFSTQLSELIFDTAEYSHLFDLALWGLALDMYMKVIFSYLRVRHKSKKLLIISVVRLVSQLSLNIFFVAYLEMGVEGILLGTLISNALLDLYMVPSTIREVGISFSMSYFKEMVRFGMPLIPSNFMAYIVHVSDRFFLNNFSGLTQTGLYTLGYRFGVLINEMVAAPFGQIWGPRRMEMFKKDDAERVFMKIFTYFTFIMMFAGLVISVTIKEVIQVMAEESYWDAYKVVPILVLSYIVASFQMHFNVGILIKKKTKYMMYANIMTAILNLALNYFLIKEYGMWGAAYATLISFVFRNILVFYFSDKLVKIMIEWWRITKLFLLAALMYYPLMMIDFPSPYLNFVLKAILCCAYPGLLVLFRFFDKDEVSKGLELMKSFGGKFIPALRK